jgi:hypothetical protein
MQASETMDKTVSIAWFIGFLIVLKERRVQVWKTHGRGIERFLSSKYLRMYKAGVSVSLNNKMIQDEKAEQFFVWIYFDFIMPDATPYC